MEKDLKLIVMKGAKPLGEKVDSYLKKAFVWNYISGFRIRLFRCIHSPLIYKLWNRKNTGKGGQEDQLKLHLSADCQRYF